MIKYFCDACSAEIRTRGTHNKCSWCGLEVCNKCLYFDTYARTTCEACAREKALKVRTSQVAIGSEEYLPVKR